MLTDLSAATLLEQPDGDLPKALHPVLVVLSSPAFQSFPRIVRFVDLTTAEFRWGDALDHAASWSNGESALVRIAASLWTHVACDMHDVLSLDEANHGRVLLAIEVHRGWRPFRDALAECARLDAKAA